MKPILSSVLVTLLCLVSVELFAQPATVSLPVSIGRDRCGGAGHLDSVYYFNYVNGVISNAATPASCFPVLKPRTFTTSAAGISFNPADQMYYYQNVDVSVPGWKTYIWRWSPLACPGVALDTLRTFTGQVVGITFDANGIAWQMDFSTVVNPATGSYDAYLRSVNFATGATGQQDTMDLTGGAKIYNAGSGDITMTPSGQMYFVINNKLFTPDYGSYGGSTHHITCTYIDTLRRPTGASNLVGLAYADGDLVSSYSTGCYYAQIDPVTGDTANVTYTYPANKGRYSVDMTQINTGIGASKKLISVTPTGTPKQYDVVYEVFVKNYGNTPLKNVQVTDNLAGINGGANLSNVTATLISNPAGVTLNPGFNGNSNINLLSPNQNLPNFPVANDNFTIQISCRLSNILDGVIYYNSAIATATGFNNAALRDSSTNGNIPDLNQNDKPDDSGEGEPTPFIVALTPITPPCAVLAQTLYTQNFGNGTGLVSTFPAAPTASTTYTGTATAPLALNRFTITNNAVNGDPANWISLTDHTGGVNGRMMVVNADNAKSIFYRDTVAILCTGQQYSLSFWAAFIGNSSYQTLCNGLGGFKYPKILVRARDLTTGLVITQFTTADISATSWQLLGMKWVMPTGYTNIIFELINAGSGGCGNDIVLDDIQFGICDPVPTASISTASSGCIGGITTFSSALSDPTIIPGSKDYQWQVSTDNVVWANIVGATSATYVINPLTVANTNKYYRVIIAATGNILQPTCQYKSPGYFLTAKTTSTAAATATKNKNNICPGIPVTLGITGGTLGAGAKWKWYNSACGTSVVDSGSSIIVTPSVTTTYYVRAEGDCNITGCQTVTVFISCDIDKDDDGIPDYVESNMPAALQDADGDGITNAFDKDYAGYVDNNNDYINDNFQADGDSDNDGIPNYLDTSFPGRVDTNGDSVDDRFDWDKDGKINMLDLDSDNDGIPDVVEAYGVDANGDGKIDNYTDTDGDGLSQNVDGNNTGADRSGAGLDVPNLDGDAIPNFLDADSDNDGIPDVIEAAGTDANNDGIIDGFVDGNGDGISDNVINLTALLKTGPDGGGDGKADSYPNKNMDNDLRANPYDLDSDGDGIVDVLEAGFIDANFDGRVDGALGADGWNAAINAAASLNLRNTDTRVNPDYLDIDSDDDGIPDNIEGQTTASYKFPAYLDTDNDGIDNNYDAIVGFGGSGIFLSDKDGDGTPDYRDLDTDADGQPDIVEGNDFNFNAVFDENVTLTLLDTDGDGLDNRFDSLNSTINVRGTSYRMGTGGSFAGDATPGSRTVVQRTTALQPDRDWRYVGIVLPIQVLKLSAASQQNNVTLNWELTTSLDVDRVELERSTDNLTYQKISTYTDNVPLNTMKHFTGYDDISHLGVELIYYRVKVIARSGQFNYSNVVWVKKTIDKTQLSIQPNPASDNTSIRLYSEREDETTIRLIDALGKTVLIQKDKVYKGNNVLQINQLSKYSDGVYSVQMLIGDEVITKKLIIQNK